MENNIESLRMHIPEFEDIIGYQYNDRNLLVNALTHSSYANENKHENLRSNERLEFLGDAVLSIIVSEEIYTKYSELSEGEMTRARASIVCESSLIHCSTELHVGDFLLLGKGEELTGGRNRISILADAFEAILGSIYLDGGFESARKFLIRVMSGLIESSVKGALFVDYKTQLQEKVQKSTNKRLIYEIIDEKGPDHNKLFVSRVRISNEVMGTGEGRSKKEAEQNAAKEALEKF